MSLEQVGPSKPGAHVQDVEGPNSSLQEPPLRHLVGVQKVTFGLSKSQIMPAYPEAHVHITMVPLLVRAHVPPF